MNYLRLKRTSKTPNRQFNEEILFADEDGVLKKVSPDSSVSEIGASSIELIGPYVVNFDTPDLYTSGADLVLFEEEKTIIRAFAISVVDFETTGSNPYISLMAGPNGFELVEYNPLGGLTVGQEYHYRYGPITIDETTGLVPAVPHRSVPNATKLQAYADADALAFTAGQMHVYALVNTED